MTLLELQNRMAEALFRPGKVEPEAAELIKPNDRLTAVERLAIYHRSYWSRILDCFYDDFPGLRAVLGPRTFDRLAKAYLSDCPSRSFTLRDLGSRLACWLDCHPRYGGRRLALALDMAKLEWAHIEAFDDAARPPLGPEDLLELGPEFRTGLQPHLRLLQLQYPVDDLRIQVEKGERPVCPRFPEAVFLAVHRYDFTVHYRRITAGDFRLLEALREGCTLGQAVEAALERSSMPEEELGVSLERSFTVWAELGWFCRPEEGSTDASKLDSTLPASD